MDGFIIFPAIKASKQANFTDKPEIAIDARLIDTVSVNAHAGFLTAGPNRTVQVEETYLPLILETLAKCRELLESWTYADDGGYVRWTDVLKSVKNEGNFAAQDQARTRAKLTETFTYGDDNAAVKELLKLAGLSKESANFYETAAADSIRLLWKAFRSVSAQEVDLAWERGPLGAFVYATSEEGFERLQGAVSHVLQADLVARVKPVGAAASVHRAVRAATGLNEIGRLEKA